jgi:transposase
VASVSSAPSAQQVGSIEADEFGSILKGLAHAANEALGLLDGNERLALGHAFEVGDSLNRARDLVVPGGWTAWLEQSFHGAPAKAYRCMRLALYRHELPEGITSIMEAERLLQGLPPTRSDTCRGKRVHPPETIDAAKQSVADGISRRETARRLGVDPVTVSRWVDPNYEQHKRRAARQAQAARAALREKEREQKIKRALREAGDPYNELYANAERAESTLLPQMRDQVDSRWDRETLSQVADLHQKYRDELVKLLGVL